MIAIIINPVSGGASLSVARRRAEQAAAHLASLNLPGDVHLTEHRGHAHALAAAAVSRGADRVIAWGGDGTVNEVASALVNTPVILGIIPAGSGNGLARELRLPTTTGAALGHACASAPHVIDAGTIDNRWFFSIAGIGFDAHVAAAFDRDGGRRGLAGYVRMTARELFRYNSLLYVVDDAAPTRALLVTFANTTQFGNGARIAPRARLDDGLLDLVMFEERSRLATIFGLPSLFTGRVDRVAGVSMTTVTTSSVRCNEPMLFHVDGEPIQGGTSLSIRAHPAVLNVAAV